MEEVLIHGSGSELQGVGRMADGRTVFVPGALPGEKVCINVVRETERFCEAKLSEVCTASDERKLPDCKYYGECGGCAAQHMNYAYSLLLKEKKVRDALVRIARLEDPCVRAAIGSADNFGYRNKAEYAVNNGEIGMFRADSKSIIPIENCMLQREENNRVLQWMKRNLPGFSMKKNVRYIVTRCNRQGQIMVTLSADAPIIEEVRKIAVRLIRDIPEIKSVCFCRLSKKPTHALDGDCSVVTGNETIREELLGLSFDLSAQTFFQINPDQTEILYKTALAAADLDRKNDLYVLDAYCGAGTITLAAARNATMALGVEIVPPAIVNAKKNAEINHLSEKVRFTCGDAALIIPQLIRKGQCFDTVIMDPPRKGADKKLLSAISAADIKKIVYVSCDPATLARDVRILAEDGYVLNWAQPVDMFPWTEHVETVVLMSKN